MVNVLKEKVYWALFSHDSSNLYLAATDQGLCYVGSPDAPFEELKAWVSKHIAEYDLI